MVKCTNGILIAERFLCDGYNNCNDNSDEIGCGEKRRQLNIHILVVSKINRFLLHK